VQGYQTMRVTGHYGHKPIQMLVDSGSMHNFVDVELMLVDSWSMHNFLDVELAKRLGRKFEPITLTVADGSELQFQHV